MPANPSAPYSYQLIYRYLTPIGDALHVIDFYAGDSAGNTQIPATTENAARRAREAWRNHIAGTMSNRYVLEKVEVRARGGNGEFLSNGLTELSTSIPGASSTAPLPPSIGIRMIKTVDPQGGPYPKNAGHLTTLGNVISNFDARGRLDPTIKVDVETAWNDWLAACKAPPATINPGGGGGVVVGAGDMYPIIPHVQVKSGPSNTNKVALPIKSFTARSAMAYQRSRLEI
jgi:hypothetical protein